MMDLEFKKEFDEVTGSLENLPSKRKRISAIHYGLCFALILVEHTSQFQIILRICL